MRKMEIALEVGSVDEVAARIVEFLEMRMPEGIVGKLKMLPKLAEMGAFFPKVVSKGPCQEVVRMDKFSLLDYPVLQCWPEDAGRFITLPLVFSRNPDTGKRNCGMYRMQVFDERTAGMHWQTHKQGAEHYRRMQYHGRPRMDVAVAIGADPATMYSAILPLPPDLDEMMIAGFLRQSPVEMVKCQTCGLEVPAHAEIVLEGYVDVGELRTEGPFGDHTGFYSLADEYPVFHVTCVTQRKDPIYATTIVGPPPMEDYYMGKAIERMFLPLMRLQLPEVRAVSYTHLDVYKRQDSGHIRGPPRSFIPIVSVPTLHSTPLSEPSRYFGRRPVKLLRGQQFPAQMVDVKDQECVQISTVELFVNSLLPSLGKVGFGIHVL